MTLKSISFEKGSLDTMIDRLCKTMNAMDREWSKKVEPALQSQIQTLSEFLNPYSKSIPLAYLLLLQTMGKNDGGLLEQEWDGYTEVSVDKTLNDYCEYYTDDDFLPNGFLPFSFHWDESILSLKLSEGDNPPIYNGFDKRLFSGSFENYLFQMAFRKAENTQFLYQVNGGTSKEGFRDILSGKSAQNIQWTTSMEFIETILKPYQLQKAWFSDNIRFCGVSSEYIVSVDLHWALNIKISSDNHIALQNMKKNLSSLLGSLKYW